MEYIIKIDQYEGPLHVLLDLIEQNKLDITSLSLASVAEQYIKYMEDEDNDITLNNLTDFLFVASRLILIKSKALMPLLKFTDEEESDMKQLEMQLEAFKLIRDIIPRFRDALYNSDYEFVRFGMWNLQTHFTPPDNLNEMFLRDKFVSVLNSIPQPSKLEEKVISDIISLEKKVNEMKKIIETRAMTRFSEIVRKSNNVEDVVVSFLALLELVKQKIIVARQSSVLGDIQLVKKDK